MRETIASVFVLLGCVSNLFSASDEEISEFAKSLFGCYEVITDYGTPGANGPPNKIKLSSDNPPKDERGCWFIYEGESLFVQSIQDPPVKNCLYEYSNWRAIPPDRVSIWWSNGFEGFGLNLRKEGDDVLRGRITESNDLVSVEHDPISLPVELRRIPCPAN